MNSSPSLVSDPAPHSRGRIIWTYRPNDSHLVGAKVEILALLKTSIEGCSFLRLRLLSGSHTGDEISLYCKVEISSHAGATCSCTSYPFPHRRYSGLCKGE